MLPLIWSPAARSAFVQTIEDATTSLEVTSEEFTDRAVLTALTHAAARHVQCRILLNADNQPSASVQAVQHAGCAVHVVPPQSANGLYLHEKNRSRRPQVAAHRQPQPGHPKPDRKPRAVAATRCRRRTEDHRGSVDRIRNRLRPRLGHREMR